MKLKDMSIAEYARIRVKLMSVFLTMMLVMDAVAITLAVGLLDRESQEPAKIAVSLLVFAAATGVVLFILTKRYLDSVTYRFAFIEELQLDAISKVAKRFFFPFVMCMASNIFLATLGAIVLLALILP